MAATEKSERQGGEGARASGGVVEVVKVLMDSISTGHVCLYLREGGMEGGRAGTGSCCVTSAIAIAT